MAAEMQNEGFKEYPALEGHVQGPDKTWYNLRAWADKEGHLQGKLEVHRADGSREKANLSFKENQRGFGATATLADGQKLYAGISGQKVEKGEKTYTHAVLGVSDMQKGEDGKTKFVALSERPGRVRMNEALASLEQPREAKLLEEKLGVSRRDLEPYRERTAPEQKVETPSAEKAPVQEKAEPTRSPDAVSPSPEPAAPATYDVKQEKTIGDREAGADHAMWSGKVVGVDREKQTIDMESKVGGENAVTRVHLQGPVPDNVEIGKVQKVAFDREKGITAAPVERKAPGKGMDR
jgi:hypothetical protein